MPGGIATNHDTISRPNRAEWFNDTSFAEDAKRHGATCESILHFQPARASEGRLPVRSWFAPAMNAT